MEKHTHNEMTNSHLLTHDFDYLEASTVDEALTWLEHIKAGRTSWRAAPT
jgi:hypothetical protein